MQNSLAFLYTNNKIWKGNYKSNLLTIASERIKYLGMNLIMDVKDLYNENYKTLLKKMNKDINKMKHISCSWIGRVNIIKISIYSK